MRKIPLILMSILAGAASLAAADTVTLVHEGHAGNLGQSVTIQLSGGLFFQDGGSSHGMWVGQISNTIDGVPTKTYCTELTQWAGSGEFEVVSVDQAPNPGNGMGQTKADAIYRLFNATNRGSDVTTSAMAAAFQAVVWEVVYDYTGDVSSIGMNNGNVVFSAGIDVSTFNQYVSFATDMQGDATPSVDALINSTRQDQLRVVPLPGAAAMAGLGLAGLAGLATRRRRG